MRHQPVARNVSPYDTVHQGQVIVSSDLDYRIPGCYEFDRWLNYHGEPCVYPTRHARAWR
jgi:hypothetical protein